MKVRPIFSRSKYGIVLPTTRGTWPRKAKHAADPRKSVALSHSQLKKKSLSNCYLFISKEGAQSSLTLLDIPGDIQRGQSNSTDRQWVVKFQSEKYGSSQPCPSVQSSTHQVQRPLSEEEMKPLEHAWELKFRLWELIYLFLLRPDQPNSRQARQQRNINRKWTLSRVKFYHSLRNTLRETSRGGACRSWSCNGYIRKRWRRKKPFKFERERGGAGEQTGGGGRKYPESLPRRTPILPWTDLGCAAADCEYIGQL